MTLCRSGWRWQGGSGSLSDNPLVGHASDFAVCVADLAAFDREWASEHAGPHVVIGHSMGGHLLLRALAEKAMSPDAAVLIAPMLGMNSGPLPAAWCARISRLMCVLGDPARMARNNEEKHGDSQSIRQALLTHTLDSYQVEYKSVV